MAAPLLGALNPSATNAQLKAAGFGIVVVSANWGTIETAAGTYSGAAMTTLQGKITAATLIVGVGEPFVPAYQTTYWVWVNIPSTGMTYTIGEFSTT